MHSNDGPGGPGQRHKHIKHVFDWMPIKWALVLDRALSLRHVVHILEPQLLCVVADYPFLIQTVGKTSGQGQNLMRLASATCSLDNTFKRR